MISYLVNDNVSLTEHGDSSFGCSHSYDRNRERVLRLAKRDKYALEPQNSERRGQLECVTREIGVNYP